MRIFPTPSEGEMKKRGNYSPSEGGHGVAYGKMRLQAVLVAVMVQRTFGRWERCGGWENAAAGSSRGGGGSAHLRKVE